MNYLTQSASRAAKAAAAALVVAMIALPASAASFVGELTFSGNFSLDDGVTLGTTTDLFFPGNDFDVDGAAGDFDAIAGIAQFDIGAIADLDLGLSGGPVVLVNIAGTSFTLESANILFQSDSILLMEGMGFVTYDGMDTAATFSLTANSIGSLDNFSAGITSIPVPGAVWLLGSALMALGLRRKS
jgi:hypothetical protein